MASKPEGIINVENEWNSTKTDSIHTASDIGNITHTHLYASGTNNDEISALYHKIQKFATPDGITIDFWEMSSYQQQFLDNETPIKFSSIKSIAIKYSHYDNSGPSGYLSIIPNFGFGITGWVNDSFVLPMSGCYCWSATGSTGIPVTSSSFNIHFSSLETNTALFEIVVMGTLRE